MHFYKKILAPFKRQNPSDRLVDETLFSRLEYEYLKDNQWIWTEKVDGTNVGIHYDGNKIDFLGHQDSSEIQSNVLTYLNGRFNNDSFISIMEATFGEKEVILFGECYGKGVGPGNQYSSCLSFIMFDIFIGSIKDTVNGGVYLARASIDEIGNALQIAVVPIILTGTIEEAVNLVKSKQKSTIVTIGSKTENKAYMEGLVGKPLIDLRIMSGERIMCKVKMKDFLEKQDMPQ